MVMKGIYDTVMLSSFVTIIAAGTSSQVCQSKTPRQPFSRVFEIPMFMVQHSLPDKGLFLSQIFLVNCNFA